MRRFIDCHLSPGGLVYLSYNAMPGWAADLPFQRLVVALGRDLSGDSAARFRAAAKTARRLLAAGAPSLAAGTIVTQLDQLEASLPPTYLAHEYMGAHWQPLFVTEVRAAMAEIGLNPAGSATLADNFDSFVLRRAERDALDGLDGPDLRELARDFLLNRRFRRDLYSRAGAELDDGERRDHLCAMRYALARPAETVEYQFRIEGAGQLTFNNNTARGIVAVLADGPRYLEELVDIGGQDLLANVIALCCADAVRPVEAEDAPVEAINRAICGRLGGPEEIGLRALDCGTVLRIEPALLRAVCNGIGPSDDLSTATWLDFFAARASRA